MRAAESTEDDSTLTAKRVTALDEILFVVGRMENDVRDADLHALTTTTAGRCDRASIGYSAALTG